MPSRTYADQTQGVAHQASPSALSNRSRQRVKTPTFNGLCSVEVEERTQFILYILFNRVELNWTIFLNYKWNISLKAKNMTFVCSTERRRLVALLSVSVCLFLGLLGITNWYIRLVISMDLVANMLRINNEEGEVWRSVAYSGTGHLVLTRSNSPEWETIKCRRQNEKIMTPSTSHFSHQIKMILFFSY